MTATDDTLDFLPTLSIELEPEAVVGICQRAEHYSVPPEEYLHDLVMHGLLTHQPHADPRYQCPRLLEVEEVMRGLRNEVARHDNTKTAHRLHRAITTLARLAMAAGLAEYPEPREDPGTTHPR